MKGERERHVSGVTNPNISGPGSAIGYCKGSNPSHISGGVVNNISGAKEIKAGRVGNYCRADGQVSQWCGEDERGLIKVEHK